jgi:hypothetical protein
MEDGPRRVTLVPVKGDRWKNETVQGHISVPVTGKRRRGQTEQLETPEMPPRRRGRPRKTIPEPTIPIFFSKMRSYNQSYFPIFS